MRWTMLMISWIHHNHNDDNVRNDARRLLVNRRDLNAILHFLGNVKEQQRRRDRQEQRGIRQVAPRTLAPSKPEAHAARIALRRAPLDGNVALRFEFERLRIGRCIVENLPVQSQSRRLEEKWET